MGSQRARRAGPGNLGDFRAGRRVSFRTQLHDDLGCAAGRGADQPGRQRWYGHHGRAEPPDPKPVHLRPECAGPTARRGARDLARPGVVRPGGPRREPDHLRPAVRRVRRRIPAAYVNVTGNIEVVAIPVDLDRGTPPGWTYVLDVSDVPARGGLVRSISGPARTGSSSGADRRPEDRASHV